jgi:hypothetical protein
MKSRIAAFDWADDLNYSGKEINPTRDKMKHDRLKYRIISWIEQKVLFGRSLGQFKNYILIKR